MIVKSPAWGILEIDGQWVSPNFKASVSNALGSFSQTVNAYDNYFQNVKVSLPLAPGNNNVNYQTSNLIQNGKNYTKVNVKPVPYIARPKKNPITVLSISGHTISYNGKAIAVIRLNKQINSTKTLTCPSAAGGDMVSGWIALKFPGCYAMFHGDRYHTYKDSPLQIIDTERSFVLTPSPVSISIQLQTYDGNNAYFTIKVTPNVNVPIGVYLSKDGLTYTLSNTFWTPSATRQISAHVAKLYGYKFLSLAPVRNKTESKSYVCQQSWNIPL